VKIRKLLILLTDTLSASILDKKRWLTVSVLISAVIVSVLNINNLHWLTLCQEQADSVSVGCGLTLSLSLESVMSACPPRIVTDEAKEVTTMAKRSVASESKRYTASNLEAARIIAADPARYPGLMLEWSRAMLNRAAENTVDSDASPLLGEGRAA
jgi:hypothetical protein